MKKFVALLGRDDILDAIAEEMYLTAKTAEDMPYRWGAAVILEDNGKVYKALLPDGVTPPEVQEGRALIIRRFYGGSEYAPEGWADSEDWAAIAALYAEDVQRWYEEGLEEDFLYDNLVPASPLEEDVIA